MVEAAKGGATVLDLQVIRPNPQVECDGRILCEIDGEPLFRTADAATAAVDALVLGCGLLEEAVDDHDVRVVSIENPSRSTHRPSGTFRVRVEGTSTGATDLILRISVPRWVTDSMVITNARALRLAETHVLAGPRLIAADLDGRASGTVATLETFLSGSSGSPPIVSAARLREAGASIARVSAVVLAPQADLPHRPRPCAADDRAADRRRGRMPTTPLLHQADERVRSHGVPAAASVFLHGDVWGGNMRWE